jgi:flagellar biogenesis protein FliO
MTRLLPAVAIVALFPLGMWWLQRRRRASGSQPIRVTAKAALGRNTWIGIVEVEGKRLLVATAERGVNLLSELEPLPTVESAGLTGIEETIEVTEREDGPRKGLIRRLQDSTLRSAVTHQGPGLELDA